ncbi:phosphodiester glycosidase family protein [Tepidiforma sp.]|uniref:phosphodiester glycosidase family protein n=1 Tax=Tepidiforma sp. TaxID=2682230 RepID=UPI002ADDAA00|nr:phosphodiester glycosidase family protein [Tepidiforma sp.]
MFRGLTGWRPGEGRAAAAVGAATDGGGQAPAEDDEPGPDATRRVVTWRRAVLAVLGMLLLAGAAAYLQKDRIAPEVADTLRATIGDERTARVESWFFRLEDRVQKVRYRVLGAEMDPFEVRPVRVEFVAREPAREVVVWAGARRSDAPVNPDAFLPQPMQFPQTRQLRDNPEPGEGTWTTAGLPRTSPDDPLLAKTFFRPDSSRPYALVGVLLVDARRVRLHLVAGTVDPGGSRGVKGPGSIPAEDVPKLLAAWNGGFKGDHGNFGMVAHGKEFQRLRNGLATVCTKKDGTFVMGEYGRDFTWDEATMEACRQNAVLLVDGGEISKRTNEGNDTWGYVQVNSSEFITWRSAIGVTKDGNLLVAAGNSLSAATLAKALWAAGAETAMQLDINSPYVLTSLFFPQPDGGVRPEKFMETMPDGPGRFLRVQERDFMYVTLDESRYR